MNKDLSLLASRLQHKLPAHLQEALQAEVQRATRLEDDNSEYIKILDFLRVLDKLPWDYKAPPHVPFRHVKRTLDREIFGMEETKALLLEYISVMRMPESKNKVPIFLLAGSPGVGKTSIARTVGEALRRPTETIFLGGLEDPQVLRGMRRTYIGSEPGLLLQTFMKTKTRHSIIVLDEIDKCSPKMNYFLLSILDYSQNHDYQDTYLNLPFDLSDTLFIATANQVSNIHPALLDRMEVIHLEAYTEADKTFIARDYILPKIRANMGLTANHFALDRQLLVRIIRDYTRESGVRQLTQALEKIGRKLAKEIVEKKRSNFKHHLSETELRKFLGPLKYVPYQKRDLPLGCVTGLAWDGYGGTVLDIEMQLIPSKTKPVLSVTGLPGKMMLESSQIVLSLMKIREEGNAENLRALLEKDLHIHYPTTTGTGVDGPSAGAAMFLALYSLLHQKPLPSSLALTGELTLSGLVTEIGGLKEKLMAASRAGKTTVMIPQDNVKDLHNIPPDILNHIEVIPVATIDEVLKHAGML